MAHHYWVPGNSAGPHVEKPGKLLLHTTEGGSIDGAIGAYRKKNSWPHLTVDFRYGQFPYRVCHHLTYDVAARSLQNDPGGVVTNTAGVIQVEVVGYATLPEQIDWAELGREVAGPICAEVGIPVSSTVTWVAYPNSYGEHAFQRLSGPDWLAYRGILGHQHAAENDHGDPGAIPIQTLLDAANPAPTPKGRSTAMMDMTTHPNGDRVDLVVIGGDRKVYHYRGDTPADLTAAGGGEDLGGQAKSVTATWAGGEYIIVVQGLDDELWTRRYVNDEVGWTDWENNPPGKMIAPAENV